MLCLVAFRAVTNACESADGASIIGSSRFTSRQDTLTAWADAHRNEVSPELEESLRKAGYLPGQDPDRISTEQWSNLGIGPFSVQVLRDIYLA